MEDSKCIVIDDVDFFIIKKLYNSKWGQDCSTWEIAKEYYKISDDCVNRESKRMKSRLLDKRDVHIRRRLKKMEKWGLVIITKSYIGKKSYNEYNLIHENVKFGRHKFPSGYQESLLLKINNIWCGFEYNTV